MLRAAQLGYNVIPGVDEVLSHSSISITVEQNIVRNASAVTDLKPDSSSNIHMVVMGILNALAFKEALDCGQLILRASISAIGDDEQAVRTISVVQVLDVRILRTATRSPQLPAVEQHHVLLVSEEVSEVAAASCDVATLTEGLQVVDCQ